MSQATIKNELDSILIIINEHPEGIRINELEKLLSRKLSKKQNKRTLLRRLERLFMLNQIEISGESVARLYKPVSHMKFEQPESLIPISEVSKEIRQHVMQPILLRQPIGYQRHFLESYQPGVDAYLSKSIRQQLHDLGRTREENRPAGTYARDILNRLLIDLSWSSSRLEGNTYSRLDTQNLIEFGLSAAGKDLFETQMILNHKTAIEMLVENANEIGFDLFTFQNLHAVLSQNLMADESASGRLRRRPVDISGSVYYPLAMPQQIENYFRMILEKVSQILDPFEQAFFLMVHIPYLQPFEDVNKRVSRLGANIPLIKNNLCPLSFIDVPESLYVQGTLGIYELNRTSLLEDVFVWAYERSCQRYLAITQEMIEPDPLKIKYYDRLIDAVQNIVKNRLQPTQKVLNQLSRDKVEPEDQMAFARFLAEALKHLHEGSIARYKLKKSEYHAWQNFLEKSKNK